MGLRTEIAAFREGEGDARRMLGEFRRAPLLLPAGDDGLMTGHQGGVRWVYAFTGEAPLARFAAARGLAGRELTVAHVLGARLLDQLVPAIGGPVGVAVDVADGEGAMLLPPVAGIVPEGAAVTATAAPGGLDTARAGTSTGTGTGAGERAR